MLEKKCIDISIIIPLYKGQKYCKRLLNIIESNCLYNNLYRDCKIEVIFVNDYPDEKIIIEPSEKLFELRLINSEKNMGIHASRVKGIRFSRGEYIIMLDQDDLVREDWLYSQWHTIIYEKSSYCVCNGWSGRFRILYREGVLKNSVNDINYYLKVGNPIWSPGQVIIKQKSLPQAWMDNIQVCNGADDFLLWIMVLKNGDSFSVNDSYLYYHTPERNTDSVNLSGMIRSLKESIQILSTLEIIKQEEVRLLNEQIEEKGWLDNEGGEEQLNSNNQICKKDYLKIDKMFHIMIDWMKIKNKGIGIAAFCKMHNYLNIAIYGMGYIGECLYEELVYNNINIIYAIDRDAVDFKQELSIFKIEDELESVDAVIITVVENTQEIIKKIKEKVRCQVITISEILLILDHA